MTAWTVLGWNSKSRTAEGQGRGASTNSEGWVMLMPYDTEHSLHHQHHSLFTQSSPHTSLSKLWWVSASGFGWMAHQTTGLVSLGNTVEGWNSKRVNVGSSENMGAMVEKENTVSFLNDMRVKFGWIVTEMLMLGELFCSSQS